MCIKVKYNKFLMFLYLLISTQRLLHASDASQNSILNKGFIQYSDNTSSVLSDSLELEEENTPVLNGNIENTNNNKNNGWQNLQIEYPNNICLMNNMKSKLHSKTITTFENNSTKQKYSNNKHRRIDRNQKFNNNKITNKYPTKCINNHRIFAETDSDLLKRFLEQTKENANEYVKLNKRINALNKLLKEVLDYELYNELSEKFLTKKTKRTQYDIK